MVEKKETKKIYRKSKSKRKSGNRNSKIMRIKKQEDVNGSGGGH